VTFEEADETYFIWYYARYLPEGTEICKNSPVFDGMHQVQYGRVAGHCQYDTQYYFDIMTVTLDMELITHYTETKCIGDRISIRCLYAKKNYNIARQSLLTIFNENVVKYFMNRIKEPIMRKVSNMRHPSCGQSKCWNLVVTMWPASFRP
jgi:hypothetical protein